MNDVGLYSLLGKVSESGSVLLRTDIFKLKKLMKTPEVSSCLSKSFSVDKDPHI